MRKCSVGGCYRTPIERAHIKPKGAGGSNLKHNLIDLCRWHHRESPDCQEHNRQEFARKYGFMELFNNAFEIERQIEQNKRFKIIARQKKALAERKRCPHCNRFLPKGFKKQYVSM